MSEIIVSVIVPTFQRDNLLDRCLTALVAQSYDPTLFEIIVVDDANQESTRILVENWAERTTALQFEQQAWSTQMLQKHSDDAQLFGNSPYYSTVLRMSHLPSIRYLPVTGCLHGPAHARNLGWKAAQGKFIAFTDDDCLPQPDWLVAGTQAMETGFAGVSGQVIVPIPAHPTDHEYNTRGLERSEFITANCFYQKSALEAVGGFDERFRMAWREDSDLYFTLLEEGYPLSHCAAAVVIHPVRPTRWGTSLKQQRKNFYNALLYKKHPRLYWKKIQPAPPFRYYLNLAFLLAALAGGIGGQPILAAMALLGWMGTTLGFILQRLKPTARTASHVCEMVITSILIPPLAVFWRIRGAIHFRVLFG